MMRSKTLRLAVASVLLLPLGVVSSGVPAILSTATASAGSTCATGNTNIPCATNLTLEDTTAGISYPAPGDVGIPAGHGFIVNGTSYEDTSSGAAPDAVWITVRNVDRLTFLQSDGTWSSRVKNYRVKIPFGNCAIPMLNGVPTFACTWTWTPPAASLPLGSYVIAAHSVDASGGSELPYQQYHVSFGSSTGSAYFTLSFGRAAWQQYVDKPKNNTGGCTTPIGDQNDYSLTLGQVAAALPTLNDNYPHLFGVGNVVVNFTLSGSTRECALFESYPTVGDLQTLASTYGWKFITAGTVYQPLNNVKLNQSPIYGSTSSPTVPYSSPAVPPAQNMTAEICGAASSMASMGFPEAAGMFAYPDNAVYSKGSPTDNLQLPITSTCFDWGRRYGSDPQTLGVQVPYGGEPSSDALHNDNPAGGVTPTPYWYARVISVSGGKCYDSQADQPGIPNGSGQTCTGPANDSSSLTYPDVPALETLAQTITPGHWLHFQFYRLVTGSHLTGPSTGPGAATWDCTSPDWRKHWTSNGENFCYNDFAAIVGALAPGDTVADPATVAAAVGRSVS